MSAQPKPGEKITIPAAQVEFCAGGKTIWIHSPDGSTLLRIKTMEKINIDVCRDSPTSHCDIIVKEDINFCISKDANY